jgi:hypothetical protein
MKKSAIWIAAGVAGIGLGIPAYAAMSPQDDSPRPSNSTTVSVPDAANDDTVTTMASTPPVVSATTPSTVEDSPHTSVDDSTHNSVDDSTHNSIEDATHNSVDDSTHNSVDDSTNDDGPAVTTANTIEDISGPCDEAEHANDPRCTGSPGTDDGSGRGRGGHGSDDSSGHGHSNDG